MQTNPVRVSHRANLLPEALEQLARTAFETAARNGTEVEASYGALESLRVRAEGRAVAVEVRMNPKVPDATARETIRRYNLFLEQVTGYSAKERAKRTRKSAGSE